MRVKMTFRMYLAYVGMSIKEMAEVLDCSAGYLQMIMSGQRKPGRRFNKDVVRATDGWINLLKSESSGEVEIEPEKAA